MAPPPRVPVRGERPLRSSLLTNTQRAAPGPGRGRVWRRHGRQEEPDQVGQRRRLPGARSGARGRRRWRPGGPVSGGAPRAAPRAVSLQAEAAAETLLGRGLLGLQRLHLPQQRRGLQVHDVRREEGHLHTVSPRRRPPVREAAAALTAAVPRSAGEAGPGGSPLPTAS